MRGSIVTNILVIIVFFILGWTLGLLFNEFSLFKLDWSINLSDIVGIIANILLAVFIACLIDKGLQNQRVEKDFYINELTDIQQGLTELEKKCSNTDPISFNITVYEVEKYKKNLINMWLIMEERNKSFHDKNQDEYMRLFKLIKTLNGQLTDSNYFLTIPHCNPIHITRGTIHLNHSVIPLIGQTFKSIKKEIFKMKIAINAM